MSTEFSGEQKLRIVLESIIRNVPKSEQSKKYGVSEEEFQSWHDHLIQNGGKIFSPMGETKSSRSRPAKKKMGPLAKFFLIISLLTNLALIIFGVTYTINQGKDKEGLDENEFSSIDSPVNLVDNSRDQASPASESKVVKDAEPDINVVLENSRAQPLPLKNRGSDIENLLASPKIVPAPSLLPPVNISEPVNEVTFMGKSYEGRHVVYLLDAGTYVLDGEESVKLFEESKEALISSMASLSPNSYFNLVLYWNLREASALGKTILKASQRNKKLAIDWITSLGGDKESHKLERNQYFPKELLYADPNPGIIGPWYGLSTGISFDPDLVFVLAANLPSYDRSEVPRSHYEGLGKINFENLMENQNVDPNISSLHRETARKWFYSITPIAALPADEGEVERMALARLGFAFGNNKTPAFAPLVWEKAFETFLSSLEVGFDSIPRTHFIVNLPQYVSWPSPLLNSAKEFAESSRGSFSQIPSLP
jgi:hypothetical protein